MNEIAIFTTIPVFVADMITLAIYVHSNPFVLPKLPIHSEPNAGPG